MIPDVVRVSQRLEDCGARRAARRLAAVLKGEFTLINRPSTARPSLFQLSSEGQAASPGRTRENFEAPSSARAAEHRNNAAPGRRGIAAAALSNCLLGIGWPIPTVPFQLNGIARDKGGSRGQGLTLGSMSKGWPKKTVERFPCCWRICYAISARE